MKQIIIDLFGFAYFKIILPIILIVGWLTGVLIAIACITGPFLEGEHWWELFYMWPIGIIILIIMIGRPIVFTSRSFTSTIYEAAWENETRLLACFPEDFTRRPDNKKWRTILKGVYSLKYHKNPYDNDCAKVTRDFFERNNIDLYSEDFDPEYVAKCIREQEIC